MSPLANCNIKVLRLKLESIDGAKVNIYIFLLVLAFDLLEGRGIDGNTINNNLLFYHMKQLESMLLCVCKGTDHREMLKCGKNIDDTLSCTSCVIFFVLTKFDLLLNRNTCTATRN